MGNNGCKYRKLTNKKQLYLIIRSYIMFLRNEVSFLQLQGFYLVCPKNFDFQVRGYPTPHTRKKFLCRFA